MANCRLIGLQLPPVGCASQEGLGYFTGGDGGLHWDTEVASRLGFLKLTEGRSGIAGRTGRGQGMGRKD